VTAVLELEIVQLGGSDGLPLLFLGPSLGTTATTLWAIAGASLAADFQTFAWNLPGHGGSAPAAGPFTLTELAQATGRAIDTAAQGRPVHYAGNSLGGAVGLQLLLDRPRLIHTATLVCTGARIGTAESWQERAALVRAKGTAATVEGSARRWFAPDFRHREPAVAKALLQALCAADDASYAWACDALAVFDVRHRLAEIRTPVLVVAGAEDQPTPVATLRAIADGVGNGRMVVLDNVAHLAPVETPRTIAQLIAGHARPRRTESGAELGDARSIGRAND